MGQELSHLGFLSHLTSFGKGCAFEEVTFSHGSREFALEITPSSRKIGKTYTLKLINTNTLKNNERITHSNKVSLLTTSLENLFFFDTLSP